MSKTAKGRKEDHASSKSMLSEKEKRILEILDLHTYEEKET